VIEVLYATSVAFLHPPPDTSSFFFLALQIRNAFLDPFGRGCAFQKMTKGLLQAPRMILLIEPLARSVLLAVIAEHVERSGLASVLS
jgi:hypothetical protein